MNQFIANRKPRQDRFTATLWIDQYFDVMQKNKYQKLYVYNKFVERMIKEKYRIEIWQLEYIGQKCEFKPTWPQFKFDKLYPQHK